MPGDGLLLAHFDRPIDLPRDERIALLGGKGDGLMRMAGELGLPVPPGFVLTTRACLVHRERGWTAELEDALRTGIEALERRTGRRFGGAGGGAGGDAQTAPEPLLVSVRSGAPISMPGMLDTVLNVGLDRPAAAAFARTHPRLANECRTRLAASFHASVGHAPPDDVWGQLRDAVVAVFGSADSARARAYRRREGLTGEGLTAVNVQAMVFGNRDARSATGVYFTRDPATGEDRPYGDLLFEAQGEDVVSGRHATEPIAALEQRLPEAARTLFAIGRRLEHAHRDLCEIEFTLEGGALWLLQVRVGKRSARAALRIAAELALDPAFPLDRREAVERTRALLLDPPQLTALASPGAAPPLARGLGASPGIAVGELATSVERALARAAEGHAVLLVRPETSPDDVEGMAVACGLLTARGGLASHAAVVARGWGIPAVVGLVELAIDAAGITLAGRRFAEGTLLSIDGTTGHVYAGALAVERRVVPEAAPLLAWAAELGIELVAPRAPAAAAAVGPATAPAPGSASGPLDPLPEALLRSLSIKGSATRDTLAAALATEPESVAAALEALVAAGEVGAARPLGFRLTDAGRLRASALLGADRAALGSELALAALETFQPLDALMKEAVTDWQLRLDGAERVPNDHTNARWDASVLDRLAATCAAAAVWLAPLRARLPRLARTTARLERALAQVRDGDGRFVASPRVDSLHGVWFELHEDLIRLAGRSRAEELAAGRSG